MQKCGQLHASIAVALIAQSAGEGEECPALTASKPTTRPNANRCIDAPPDGRNYAPAGFPAQERAIVHVRTVAAQLQESSRVRMEAWRQWPTRREKKACPTKREKNLLDSDRPSHGRPFHSSFNFFRSSSYANVYLRNHFSEFGSRHHMFLSIWFAANALTYSSDNTTQ